MIRAALICYRDEAGSGGGIRVAEVLADFLHEFGVEPHLVFAYGNRGPIATRTVARCHFVGASGSRDFTAWRRARSLLRAIDADVIHFVDSVVWLSVATEGLRAKRVVHLHGRPIPGERVPTVVHVLWRWFRFSCDCHIAITQGTASACIELGFSRADRVVTVYNGVDCDRFGTLPGAAAARESLSLPPRGLYLGFSGRLVWWKGCDDFLRVLSRLPDEWKGVVIGEGPEEDRLRELSRILGLESRVHFRGLLGDVRPFLGAVDALAFMSRFEPFGLVTAEAMAGGVPVFGFKGDGDFAEEQRPLVTKTNSRLIPRSFPQDPRRPEDEARVGAVVEQIEEYGRHPDRFEAMRQCARSWVRERFSAQLQARCMAEVYRKLVRGEALE